jgi:uncharacterized membrane protein YkvI
MDEMTMFNKLKDKVKTHWGKLLAFFVAGYVGLEFGVAIGLAVGSPIGWRVAGAGGAGIGGIIGAFLFGILGIFIGAACVWCVRCWKKRK